ncbi:MAG: hypothetical protein ACT4PO_11645 [Actinomycetota bacterium]
MRVSLYRGPSYVRSIAFRVRAVPQDGLIDVWFEAFTEKLRAVAEPLALEAAQNDEDA